MTASPVHIRSFERADRDQLAVLVNAHLAVALPGTSIPVQALLSSLEREPGEFIVDPWVAERVTLVAERRGRVVAAAQLLRYSDDAGVGTHYRNAGEIRWLVCWPDAPFWTDSQADGEELGRVALARIARWGVSRAYADGALPRPGVYGVPECWPHIRAIYDVLGFVPERHELVLLATIDDLPRRLPDDGMRRSLGINGTRFTASDDAGYIEIDTSLEGSQRLSAGSGTADIGNLEVRADRRRQGVGRRLLAAAADWAFLAGIDRVLAYAEPTENELVDFLRANGFRDLTVTALGFRIVTDGSSSSVTRNNTVEERRAGA